MKGKKIGRILIQSTSRSRRIYKMRGRGPSIQGRPRKNEVVQTEIEVNTDGGEVVVRHKLPSMKRKAADFHSLMNAVNYNKRSSKKH